jgi:hypothetical protein
VTEAHFEANHKRVSTTTAEEWAQRGPVSCATEAEPLTRRYGGSQWPSGSARPLRVAATAFGVHPDPELPQPGLVRVADRNDAAVLVRPQVGVERVEGQERAAATGVPAGVACGQALRTGSNTPSMAFPRWAVKASNVPANHTFRPTRSAPRSAPCEPRSQDPPQLPPVALRAKRATTVRSARGRSRPGTRLRTEAWRPHFCSRQTSETSEGALA